MTLSRMQPTGWIRASDSPAPSTSTPNSRRSPTKRVTSGSRLGLKENQPARLTMSDTPKASPPVRRLALQERPDNHQMATGSNVTPAKRSLPSWSDAGSAQKKQKPKPSGSGKTTQTTLSTFLSKKPDSVSSTPTPRVQELSRSNDNKENAPAASTSASEHHAPAKERANQEALGNDDDDIFERAARMLKSGRFGSVPRSVRVSTSDIGPLRSRDGSMDSPRSPLMRSPVKSRSPVKRKATEQTSTGRLSQRGEVGAATALVASTSRPVQHLAEPRAQTTEPTDSVRPDAYEETPFMHETLSNFRPFAWQAKAKSIMPKLKRHAGVSEEQILAADKALMDEQLAAAHRRMMVETNADDGEEEEETPDEVVDETQLLGPEGGEYEDSPAQDDLLLEPEADHGPAAVACGTNEHRSTTAGADLESSRQEATLIADSLPPRESASPLRPLSQQMRPPFRPEAMTRSPRTNRKVYALETQLRGVLPPTSFRAISAPKQSAVSRPAPAAPAPTSHAEPNAKSSSQRPLEPAQDQASATNGARASETPRKQVRRPIRTQADILAVFDSSSPLTPLSSDEQASATTTKGKGLPTSSASRSRATAESARDGGASESARASSTSSSDTPDPRHGPEDETYMEPDEMALRRALTRTPQRYLPPRKAALSSAQKSARQSPHPARDAPVHPQPGDSQATQPLAWKASEVPPTDVALSEGSQDETQPLVWESDSEGDGNASERSALRQARVVNEHVVRSRASQVRLALDSQPHSLRVAADGADSVPTSEDDRDRQRRSICQLHRVRSFRRRNDSASQMHQSLPAMASESGPSRLREEHHASPSSSQSKQRNPLRPAGVSAGNLSPASPVNNTDRFNAIVSALHQARKDEAAEEAAQLRALSADDAKKAGGQQTDLARYGFAPPPRRDSAGFCGPSSSASRPETFSKAPLSLDLRDDLSDDEVDQDEEFDELISSDPLPAPISIGPAAAISALDPSPPTHSEDDDATQELPWSSDDEFARQCDDLPKRSQVSAADSETLPYWLEAEELAARYGAHGAGASPPEAPDDGGVIEQLPVDEGDGDGDTTIVAPADQPLASLGRHRRLERTDSGRFDAGCDSSSVPSSTPESKDWMPGESMKDANEAVLRFIHGRG